MKRKISDLKVVQLRNELEKRDLDKTGFKAALIERLSKALEEEGLDPEAHEFEVPADPMSAKKTRKVAESESDHQTVDEEEEEEEKEGSSEVMDADALQLSIEDEEKLLNEEEESFDKSKGEYWWGKGVAFFLPSPKCASLYHILGSGVQQPFVAS